MSERRCLVADVWRSAADFIAEREIVCSVLGGVDPDSGAIGRDLDVYLPDKRAAKEVLGHVADAFNSRGFEWTTPMHPLWGLRYLGITPVDYGEFHIVSGLRLGSLDLASVRPLAPETGQLGLPFDPALMFGKQIVRNSRAILKQNDIWSHRPLPAIVVRRHDEVRSRFESQWPGAGLFVDACMAADSPDVRVDRRREFRKLFRTNWRNHPTSAVSATLAQARRKVLLPASPCTPYVSIRTTRSLQEVRAALEQSVGHAFIDIHVKSEPWSWLARRRVQARQNLAVFVTGTQSEHDDSADVKFDLDADKSMDSEPMVRLRHGIFDGIVALNDRWRDEYAAT